jgi:MoaA/NifB/PqqE/SkfB family radical SAM enzyme
MIILLDLTGTSVAALNLWEQSGFCKRLESLGGDVLCFGGPENGSHSYKTVFTLSEVWQHPEADTGIVHIEGTQLFLDSDVILNGLLTFNRRSPDYYTQWEHVRLPVGVGARFFAAQRMAEEKPQSIQTYLSAIRAAPHKFDVYYDDHDYVDHSQHLLDSRANTQLIELSGKATDIAWNLNGFLAFANGKDDELTYSPDMPAAMVDERKMPATYGFESSGCAEYPTYIMFDLTNRCNAACIHCPQSIGFDGQDTTVFLPLNAFKQVIDECKGKQIDFVRITADGEPTLHPDFWDMLDYAKQNGVGPIGLTTNGSALNQKNAERLIDSNVFMVDISLDAFSAETFEIVRAGLSYGRTVGNVENLIKLREEKKSPLKIMVSFVKQKENMHEVDSFRKHWEGRVDQVLIREMISNVGLNNIEGSSENEPTERWPCPHWWRRVIINYDGVLKACPIDWQGKLTNAPLDESAVSTQWHDEFYRDYRMQHLNNEHNQDSACNNCRDWRGTPWSLGYEKVIRSLMEEA